MSGTEKMSGTAKKNMGGADPINAHIGRRLRYLRLSRRMSQERLGAAVNLTFQQIQKYEKGASRVSGSMIYRFAGIFGVPVSAFFEGIDGDQSILSTDGAPLTDSLLVTAAEIQSLGDANLRVSIANLVRAVARLKLSRVH
jgi:transcriptional regulator with XRE-family HTH domain